MTAVDRRLGHIRGTVGEDELSSDVAQGYQLGRRVGMVVGDYLWVGTGRRARADSDIAANLMGPLFLVIRLSS
jgi:hypothetical protein